MSITVDVRGDFKLDAWPGGDDTEVEETGSTLWRDLSGRDVLRRREDLRRRGTEITPCLKFWWMTTLSDLAPNGAMRGLLL